MKKLNTIIFPLFAILALTGCKGSEDPKPEQAGVAFTCSFQDPTSEVMPSKWVSGQEIMVTMVTDGKTASSSAKVSEVSSDGKTAKINFPSMNASEISAIYAYLPNTGIKGMNGTDAWTVNDMSNSSIQVPSVTVSTGSVQNKTLAFRNIFAVLKFEVADSKTSYVEFSGNDGEVVGKDVLISTNYSASDASAPAFEPSTVIKKNISGTGTYYIGLFPGLKLNKGYTLKSFDAQGNQLNQALSEGALTISGGSVYSAVAFGEYKPEITFTATFADASSEDFKSSWAEGDKINVVSVKNREYSEETLTAGSISSDGKTASFTSAGALFAGAKYYAYLPGSGVAGYREEPPTAWHVGNLEGKEDAIPSVTVASCEDGSNSFVFQNAYSLIKFKVEDSRFKSVTLTGNNGEKFDMASYVKFGGVTAYGNDNPGAKESRAFDEPGTYYLGIRPGISFSKGFTLTGLDADGKEVGALKRTSYVKFEGGTVLDAGTLNPSKPVTISDVFDESHVVASFAVISDVHINANKSSGEAVGSVDKFKNALNQCNAMAKQHGADGLDGVLVVGDFIDSPNSASQLNSFKNAYESIFDPVQVPMFYAVGNHEMPGYAWPSNMVAAAKYIRNGLGSKYYLVDADKGMSENYECREAILGGIHVLAISPDGDQPISYDAKAAEWLDSRLKALTEENPGQYVIVLTHPMVTGTVYGSLLGEDGGIWESSHPHYWASDALTPILRKYSQVVVFGGHLHFPLADPRSIWQGDFTAVGCGSVRYMACENGHYLHMRSATVMNDSFRVSSGNFVQFDWNGNMRIYQMDFTNGAVYRNAPYEIQYPDVAKSNLKKFSHTALSLANGKPSVSTLTISDFTNTSFTANFAAGTDDEFVHHYVLTVSRGSAKVGEARILSDFYLYPGTASMKKTYSETVTASDLGLSSFETGSYTVSLRAYDSWDAESDAVTATMTLGSNSAWVTDASGSRPVSGGDGTAAHDFLSYSGGILSWSANTTGKPRSAAITLPDGSVFSITQIGPDDFKGNWTFTAKVFAGAGAYKPKDAAPWTVSIGKPLKAESLKYANDSKTYANNIGIAGLYGNAVLDGCVDIDYDAQTVRVGLFLDCRDDSGQLISSGASDSNGKYAIFSPELVSQTGTTWGSPWFFNETDLGTPDYTWMWLTVSSDFSKLSYANRTSASRVLDSVSQYPGSARYIGGVCVILCATNSFNHASVGAAQAGGYANVFQMNSSTGALQLVRQ